jgi:hypothetical protein
LANISLILPICTATTPNSTTLAIAIKPVILFLFY